MSRLCKVSIEALGEVGNSKGDEVWFLVVFSGGKSGFQVLGGLRFARTGGQNRPWLVGCLSDFSSLV